MFCNVRDFTAACWDEAAALARGGDGTTMGCLQIGQLICVPE
jgi:hypothetical protein